MPALTPVPTPDDAALRLIRGESVNPHDILGAHPLNRDGVAGVVVRAWQPRAQTLDVLIGPDRVTMQRESSGLYSAFLPGRRLPLPYRLEMRDETGQVQTFDDPYRFLPTIGEVDLHLFNEGRHLRLWEKMGAHLRTVDGVDGTAFTVWAPNAARVSVLGEFNRWDGRAHTMRRLGSSGVFELFIPGVGAETLYKFEIRTRTGALRVKTDPFAAKMEQGEGHASIVQPRSVYAWHDGPWMAERAESDLRREPMSVYEVHLGSWMRGEDNRLLSYREIAPRLASHVSTLGFTHVELLPVQEHPFGGSWGYQVGGYFAPNSRHGSPDDLRYLVDTLHEAGIGVFLDWVPAHFPKDDWALRRFDGTACYEHEDPRLGDHPEWGTHIFNYARHEVRNFLVANALYWIEEFHIDGLRVDAVASMLYLDYGREAGQWLRNRFGGRENLEAVAFLKQLNHAMQSLHPGVVTIAEESTSWPRVTGPIREGGLGFTFKWNMGWMHDTLDYFRVDPLFRKGAHEKLTFAIWYEYSERFVNPLSHDEVVHLKRSLLEKMPGDLWQKFANLRALIGYSVTRPGKSLFFMGTELAPHGEWNHDVGLDWSLLEDPRRRGLTDFVQALQETYRAHACFWRADHDPAGFCWIDVSDRDQSVLSYARFDGAAHAVVVLNLTPVPRDHYRLGVPGGGRYRLLLNSDATAFGGSGYPVHEEVDAEPTPYHGFDSSIELSLPPLAMLVLLPEGPVAPSFVPPAAARASDPGGESPRGKSGKQRKERKSSKAPKPAKKAVKVDSETANKPDTETTTEAAAKPVAKPVAKPAASKSRSAGKTAGAKGATRSPRSTPGAAPKTSNTRTARPATPVAAPAATPATASSVSTDSASTLEGGKHMNTSPTKDRPA